MPDNLICSLWMLQHLPLKKSKKYKSFKLESDSSFIIDDQWAGLRIPALLAARINRVEKSRSSHDSRPETLYIKSCHLVWASRWVVLLTSWWYGWCAGFVEADSVWCFLHKWWITGLYNNTNSHQTFSQLSDLQQLTFIYLFKHLSFF